MTVLLDSSAWLEYFFGSEKGEKIRSIVESDHEIVVCKINLFEVYHKILKERGKEEAIKFVSFMLLRSEVDEMDSDTIKSAGEEKKTRSLGMADALILATAMKYNATLYTGDQDFIRAKNIVTIVFL